MLYPKPVYMCKVLPGIFNNNRYKKPSKIATVQNKRLARVTYAVYHDSSTLCQRVSEARGKYGIGIKSCVWLGMFWRSTRPDGFIPCLHSKIIKNMGHVHSEVKFFIFKSKAAPDEFGSVIMGSLKHLVLTHKMQHDGSDLACSSQIGFIPFTA